jgi:type 2 lantibiotic biosynthesis protein LanM
LQALGEADLLWQCALIQGSFHAKMARVTGVGPQAWDSEPPTLLTGEQMIAEAAAIAADLEATAIVAPDGEVNWIGLGFVFEAERVQLQVLSDSLYDGQSGIALFLAALHRTAGQPYFRELALRIVQGMQRRSHMRNADAQQRWARFTGIGGASGIGAMVYVTTKVSEFLGEGALLDDARALTEWLTPELIGADKKLDVISGAAGAILGLLSLYRVTGDSAVLAKAIACGQHLLDRRVSYNGAPQAWQTVGDVPLTGFSHGAAGIAYALLRLYAVTGNKAYHEAALEGIQYERSTFSEDKCNWPDFRTSESHPAENHSVSAFPVQWCHGATGIGLARIGSFGIVPAPDIEREIEIALQTTCDFGLQAVDHLCCGNMGRIEALLVGADRLGRRDWQQIALGNASKVVARAARDGAYRLFGNLPCSVSTPSFFRGTSGIGYQLLRLADPSLPSVLLWE